MPQQPPKPDADGPPRNAAMQVVRTLRGAGHLAYFAGGCVRDELLGLPPADFDVATDATPDRVRTMFPRASEVGKAFGVVIVLIDGHVIEVATFRADGTYSDSRRPDQVRFSTPDDDARRRDFTVNALYLDPLADPGKNPPGLPRAPISGAVIDLVGGVPDLHARVIRAVGDPEQRLAEDHLRALRAARLAAKLGFRVDEGTARAIRAHAAELRGVSRERIGDEVRRMLSHPSRAAAAGLMADLGLVKPVLGVDPPPAGAEGGALSTLPTTAAYATALGAWAMDLGLLSDAGDLGTVASAWRTALCLSNAERDALRDLLEGLPLLLGNWSGLGVAVRKRAAG
jgi:poly(A) polymerase